MKQPVKSEWTWWWHGDPAPKACTVDGPKGRILDARGKPVHRAIGFQLPDNPAAHKVKDKA